MPRAAMRLGLLFSLDRYGRYINGASDAEGAVGDFPAGLGDGSPMRPFSYWSSAHLNPSSALSAEMKANDKTQWQQLFKPRPCDDGNNGVLAELSVKYNTRAERGVVKKVPCETLTNQLARPIDHRRWGGRGERLTRVVVACVAAVTSQPAARCNECARAPAAPGSAGLANPFGSAVAVWWRMRW